MARSIVVWWLAAFVAILLVAHVPLARIAHREARTTHAGLPPCGPEPHLAPCARHEAETVGAWIGEAALHTLRAASRSAYVLLQAEHESMLRSSAAVVVRDAPGAPRTRAAPHLVNRTRAAGLARDLARRYEASGSAPRRGAAEDAASREQRRMRIDPHLGKEGRPPADRPVGPHSSVLPRGVDYAVHADHTVAAQRSRLAGLGGAPGLSRAEENGMTLDQLDRYLRKQTAARGARGKRARKSAAKNCARILEIHEPGADCEAMPNSRPCKRAVAARARSTARGGELPRIFAISDRKDYKDFVRDELVELGLCGAEFLRNETLAAAGLGFYLGEQFESNAAPRAFWAEHNSPAFAEGAAIGAMPGVMPLFGTKQSYADFYWKCRSMAGAQHFKSSLCPDSWVLSWNVNGEERRWKKSFKRQALKERDVEHFRGVYDTLKAMRKTEPYPLVFIVKPQKDTYLSRGMHLARLDSKHVKDRSALLRWIQSHVVDKSCDKKWDAIRCARRRVTFQLYVQRPATVHGRKFDMRFWVLFTSLDPLRVYVMRHAYPKVATKKYAGLADLQDQCEHIRLLLDPSCNESVAQFLRPYPDGYPKSTGSPIFFEALDFWKRHASRDELGRSSWVAKESYWQSTVWPSLERAFTSVAMLARDSLLAAARDAPAPPGGAPAHRRFALLSPDLAVDDEGAAFIEEINTNGMIMGTNERGGGYNDLFHDDDYLRGFLRIVGADGFPRRGNYSARLDSEIAAWCARRRGGARGGCAPELVDELERTVHEEAHAGKHWYRLYPPLPCHKRHGHVCDVDDDGKWWPEQHRVTREMRKAMRERDLDEAVRAFVRDVDTEAIHGEPMVPGHARWYPRIYNGLYAP
ncbi:putative tubulin polyglutamylase [Aureococcus anophagefferens]|uniref:Tubulin polyglutamylase n=1 Tax=Aureococcus anophagefferens TaxID=44056 RepID=A0ABR1G2T1_AURAN